MLRMDKEEAIEAANRYSGTLYLHKISCNSIVVDCKELMVAFGVNEESVTPKYATIGRHFKHPIWRGRLRKGMEWTYGKSIEEVCSKLFIEGR